MRHGVLFVVALSSFAAVASANGGATRSESARVAPVGAHLVFTSNRDGDDDVYAVNPSGRVAALTRNRLRDSGPVLARNGRWLAVQREFSKLVLISGDGRRERVLGEAAPVAFSPNSRLLAYTRGLDDERMFVTTVPRGQPRFLGNGYPIEFSPDNRLLAFSTDSYTVGVVDVMTARRTVVPRSQFRDFLGWSPDGRRIALRHSKDEGDTTIETLLVVDARRPSLPPRELIRSSEGLVAEWLSAGRIGFERRGVADGKCDVGVVAATGGAPRVISPTNCQTADWSAKSNRLAFRRSVDEQTSELVIARDDGGGKRIVYRSEERNITNLSFQWSPSGKRFVLAMHADAGDELLVARRPNWRLQRLARGRFGLLEAGAWSPDDRHLALPTRDGLSIASVKSGKVRRVWSGSVGGGRWVVGALARKAPAADPPPRSEVAQPRQLQSRGVVYELGSDGANVAAVLGRSRADCDHVAAWTAGTRRIVRFSRPELCGEIVWPFNVTLAGTRVRWSIFFCGSVCYVSPCTGDLGRPFRSDCDQESEVPGRPPRPPPPAETRRGVSVATTGGTITLRREQDGRVRTIRPPGGAVDAELENEGLFYAFNVRRGAMPGRIVFIPFASLFD